LQEKFEEVKKNVENEQFTSDADRYIVTTKQGLIDEESVQKYRDAHAEAVKEQNGHAPDPPTQVNGISHN